MIILLIGLITLATIVNITYHEYRIIKKDNDKDLMNAYVNRRLNRKYDI